MKMKIPDYIRSIRPYKPGKPIEELEREYGVSGSVKLASNENPMGPSPAAVAAMKDAMEKLHRYPDGRGYELVQKLSAHLDVPAESIVLGNGSDEIIGMITRIFLAPGDEAIMTDPSFLMYDIMVRSCGADPVFVPLKSLFVDLDAIAGQVTDKTRIIFLNNPVNPTGTIITKRDFKAFLDKIPEDVAVVLDEAYIEFVKDPECLDGIGYTAGSRPVAVLRTFSKAYGLAGIRIGYGVMPPEMAELVHRVRQPFNCSAPAQAAAVASLADAEFLERSVALNSEQRELLRAGLEGLGYRPLPSAGNFLTFDAGPEAANLNEQLLRRGVIVRPVDAYQLPNHLRVSVGTPAENRAFLGALATAAGGGAA